MDQNELWKFVSRQLFITYWNILTHISMVSFLWGIGKLNAALHLQLFCLLRENSSKN